MIRVVPILLLLLTAPSKAGEAEYFNIYNVPNSSFNFGTWSIGMGAQSRIATFCIASANYNNAFTLPPPALTPTPVHENYQVKTLSRYSVSGYYFFLDRNDSNTGNARMSFTMEHRDTLDSNIWNTMSHDAYGLNQDGQFKGCKDGKNGRLRISIPVAQLENARAGPYRAKLRIEGYGGSSQTVTDSDNFKADITISDIVRVSGLTDIPFGIHTPGSDRTAERTFCVYSNNDAGGYSITISSPNQDGGGNFFLNGTADAIPYDVYFKDNTTAGFGTQVGASPIAGTGNNAASNCSNVDNAKISVNVNDTEIVESKTGTYSDTLTILVAPN